MDTNHASLVHTEAPILDEISSTGSTVLVTSPVKSDRSRLIYVVDTFIPRFLAFMRVRDHMYLGMDVNTVEGWHTIGRRAFTSIESAVLFWQSLGFVRDVPDLERLPTRALGEWAIPSLGVQRLSAKMSWNLELAAKEVRRLPTYVHYELLNALRLERHDRHSRWQCSAVTWESRRLDLLRGVGDRLREVGFWSYFGPTEITSLVAAISLALIRIQTEVPDAVAPCVEIRHISPPRVLIGRTFARTKGPRFRTASVPLPAKMADRFVVSVGYVQPAPVTNL